MSKGIELTKIDDNKWKVSFYTNDDSLENVVKALKEATKDSKPKNNLTFNDWVKEKGYEYVRKGMYKEVGSMIITRSFASLAKDYVRYLNND